MDVFNSRGRYNLWSCYYEMQKKESRYMQSVRLKYIALGIFVMFRFGTDTQWVVTEYVYFIERKHYEKV
ncbi:hypothetical protein [Paenibacillus sp. QZ-Y1]|uniref:hypothetical protein n=1 Tax=Paenibacillus sp. QZ-Y1 TaxID=3414511 RepID=UPI003F7B1EDB